MDIKLISGALGAEIFGIDLKDSSEKNFSLINKLLLEHKVLFFREQNMGINIQEYRQAFDERDELVKNLRATIECVLDQEAPITTKRLGNLVAETWNYEQSSRSRNFVLKYVDKNLITSDEYGDFVWKSPTQSQNLTFYRPSKERVRDINEIHPQEYLQCLLHLIEAGRSMEREEAAKGLAKMNAFKNTARIKNHMQAMIDYAIQNSDLTESEGILSLSSDRII